MLCYINPGPSRFRQIKEGGGSDIKREEDNTRAEVCSLPPCAEKNMPYVSNGDVSNGDRKGNRQGKLLYGRGCA